MSILLGQCVLIEQSLYLVTGETETTVQNMYARERAFVFFEVAFMD